MKRFLQEVVWRLSLVAALLTCASLAAWGQEKVIHPVYTNIQGNGISIKGPTEVADGETLRFEIVGDDEYSLEIWQDESPVLDHNFEQELNTVTVRNVTGTILINLSQAYYFTLDGVRYKTYVNSVVAFADVVEATPPSNVELKNFVEHDGVTYIVGDYNGCYNQFDNITSLTLPNTWLTCSPNSLNGMKGLKE